MKEFLIVSAVLVFILCLVFIPAPKDTITPRKMQTLCYKENSDKIYERYSQCVKDSGGNNDRCGDSARDITCPWIY